MSRYLKKRSSLWMAAVFSLSPGVLFAQETITYTTPGTDVFTVPENVSTINVQVWGAGAGGRAQAGQSAGGGGGGFAALNGFEVAAGQTYRVLVGAGGAADAGGSPSAFGGDGPVPAGCLGTDADACAAGGRVTVPPGSYGGCSTNPDALPLDECVGDEIFAGGNGAPPGSNVGGGGGGSAFTVGNGAPGAAGAAGGAGGAGTGDGGNGGTSGVSGSPGIVPGGGGGGRGAGAAGLGLTSGSGAGGTVIVTFAFDPPPPPPPPPSATAIPTASTWGLLILGGLLGALGGRKLRRRG